MLFLLSKRPTADQIRKTCTKDASRGPQRNTQGTHVAKRIKEAHRRQNTCRGDPERRTEKDQVRTREHANKFIPSGGVVIRTCEHANTFTPATPLGCELANSTNTFTLLRETIEFAGPSAHGVLDLVSKLGDGKRTF